MCAVGDMWGSLGKGWERACKLSYSLLNRYNGWLLHPKCLINFHGLGSSFILWRALTFFSWLSTSLLPGFGRLSIVLTSTETSLIPWECAWASHSTNLAFDFDFFLPILVAFIAYFCSMESVLFFCTLLQWEVMFWNLCKAEDQALWGKKWEI